MIFIDIFPTFIPFEINFNIFPDFSEKSLISVFIIFSYIDAKRNNK